MKVKSFEIIMGWLKDFLLWDKAALAFHLQRPTTSYRSVCIPVAAEHCDSTAIQPLKNVCVVVVVAVVVIEPWFCMPHQHKRPTSAGNEPKLMVSLALSIVPTHVSCPLRFICLIQFSTANDSELEGNYRERRTKKMIIGWKSPKSI